MFLNNTSNTMSNIHCNPMSNIVVFSLNNTWIIKGDIRSSFTTGLDMSCAKYVPCTKYLLVSNLWNKLNNVYSKHKQEKIEQALWRVFSNNAYQRKKEEGVLFKCKHDVGMHITFYGWQLNENKYSYLKNQ